MLLDGWFKETVVKRFQVLASYKGFRKDEKM
jgi:hypothetical protein